MPRFKQLAWPDGATPTQAGRSAYLRCPRPGCGGVIEEHHKAEMNRRGVYVAPGQTVTCEGIVEGDPPDASTLSFWVSGLASPFVSFGQRAEAYLTAHLTGENSKIQTEVNAGFGEVYSPGGGDVPEWQEVLRLREPYAALTVPERVILLTAGVDVQANRLPFVIRGWGARMESWLVHHGELWGDTARPEVWGDLHDLLRQHYDDLPIKLAFVDSGFRPGKKEVLPLNRVYDFCRQHRLFVHASKGSSSSMSKPLVMSRIEVDGTGHADRFGLELVRLDTHHWKGFVQERLRWPQDQPGAFHLHQDITEDYAQQLVSEAPVKKPGGSGWTWVQRSRENHFLDCEAMAAAAAFMAGVQNLTADRRRIEPKPDGPRFVPPNAQPATPSTQAAKFAAYSAMFNR